MTVGIAIAATITGADETGIPIAMVIDSGNVIDITLAEQTVTCVYIAHGAIAGSEMLADKGYDSFPFRTFLTK